MGITPLQPLDIARLLGWTWEGRENLEDYNVDFLIMLETWEGGEKYLIESNGSDGKALIKAALPQVIETARLLGWTWEGGEKYLIESKGFDDKVAMATYTPQAIETARLLGWTEARKKGPGEGKERHRLDASLGQMEVSPSLPTLD